MLMTKEQLIEKLKVGEVHNYHYEWNGSGRIFPKIYKDVKLYDEKGNYVTSQNEVIHETKLSFTRYYLIHDVYDGIAIRGNEITTLIKKDEIGDDGEYETRIYMREIDNNLLNNFEESKEKALEKILDMNSNSQIVIIDGKNYLYFLFGTYDEQKINELLEAIKLSKYKFTVL